MRWAAGRPKRATVWWKSPHAAVHLRRLVESDALRANPQLRDVKNKDASQRERLLKGLTILQGFRQKGSAGRAARSTTPMTAAPIRPP
jgi:hypothetical protein